MKTSLIVILLAVLATADMEYLTNGSVRIDMSNRINLDEDYKH